MTENHKYVGLVIDDNLSFETNLPMVCKKLQQRMFFLRKMNVNVNVNVKTMMTLFFKTFIEYIFSFCIVWFGNLTLTIRNRLNGLVKGAG